MSTWNDTLDKYLSYAEWLEDLRDLPEEKWFTPIDVGKWSPSEIIGHILFWDRYFKDEIIPMIEEGDEIRFPEFEPFNKNAAEYARNASKNTLLNQSIEARKALIARLREMDKKDVNKPIKENGNTHNPITGELITFNYTIAKEMVPHDEHHKKQIIEM